MFVLVKPEAKGLEISSKRKEKEEEESAILYNEINSSDQEGSIDENNNTTINNAKRTRVLKNIAGIVLSSLSGVFYSMSVTTIDYVQTNYPGASDNQNDYAFAYNSGIFLGSLFYFVAYCIYMKNKPRIYSEIMLPGMISGAIWLVSHHLEFFYLGVIIFNSTDRQQLLLSSHYKFESVDHVSGGELWPERCCIRCQFILQRNQRSEKFIHHSTRLLFGSCWHYPMRTIPVN